MKNYECNTTEDNACKGIEIHLVLLGFIVIPVISFMLSYVL